MTVTIKDIARIANVSTATVSYVINDTRPVSPERATRVREAIAQLGYAPMRSLGAYDRRALEPSAS
jgi:LacI family transcriptional regulator